MASLNWDGAAFQSSSFIAVILFESGCRQLLRRRRHVVMMTKSECFPLFPPAEASQGESVPAPNHSRVFSVAFQSQVLSPKRSTNVVNVAHRINKSNCFDTSARLPACRLCHRKAPPPTGLYWYCAPAVSSLCSPRLFQFCFSEELGCYLVELDNG